MNKLSRLTAVTLTLLSAIFLYNCSSSKTVEVTDLKGFWVLKSLKGEDSNKAFEGSTPSLEFNLDNKQITGSGGCNRYNGEFSLEGNIFKAPKLASTMRLCMESNKEDTYLALLSDEEGLTISIEKSTLTFKKGQDIVLEFTKGDIPNTTTKPATTQNLLGTWTLSKIHGKDATELFGKTAATLNYSENGSVSGNAGCNNYRGNATIKDSTITFGPMMATEMACPQLEGEQQYLSLLEQPMKASISGEKLLFTHNGNIVLEFLKDPQ